MLFASFELANNNTKKWNVVIEFILWLVNSNDADQVWLSHKIEDDGRRGQKQHQVAFDLLRVLNSFDGLVDQDAGDDPNERHVEQGDDNLHPQKAISISRRLLLLRDADRHQREHKAHQICQQMGRIR